MERFDPIHFNLKEREVTIHQGDEVINLKAKKNDRDCGLMAKKGVQKLLKQGLKSVSGHLFLLLPKEKK